MGVPGIGRRQKVDALRKLQGSRVRPHQHKQPTPKPGRPLKPTYLGPVSGAMWDELAAILDGEHRLSESDGMWLLNAAEAWMDYQRWRVEAEHAPMTQVKVTVDSAGSEHQEIKPHPAHQQARLARKAFTDLLKEAGLTPASRARVSVPVEVEAVDATETFLRAVK